MHPARQASRPAASLAALGLLAALVSCGGGVVPDPGGTSPDVRLNCAGPCVPSDTLSTGAITAYLYVVDDGTRTQAQAGFNTDGSIFHNVELEGDTLWFVDGDRQTRMALSREGAWDFLLDLLTLGQPYLADIAPQPTTARDYQFQLRRAGGTVTSQVTLPAPFEFATPGMDQVFPIGAAAVPITVTRALDVGAFSTTFVCTDANGNQTSNRVPDGRSFGQVDASGANFQFDVRAFLASLEWDQDSFPPAAVARCDVTLRAIDSAAGALAADFHAFSILQATQLRSVRILLR
ncbi:MAG TPA: hypothetical protein VIN75_06110 [Burkholderiaceae bacterium]